LLSSAICPEEERVEQPQEQIIRQRMLGLLLRHARQRAGRSQAELAASLHISTNRYAQYEHGQREPLLSELEVVAELCDVPLGFFFDDQASVEDEGTGVPQVVAQRIRQKIMGAQLHQARQCAGKSQKEVAEALGIPARHVSEYESGERAIPASELTALATYLNVDLGHFKPAPGAEGTN
jgi:transcriptional regulator with XRE-family HTH domain